MLLERAVRLGKDIEGLAKLKDLAKESELLRTRALQLEQVAVRLVDAVRALELLEAQGVAVGFSSTSAYGLRNRSQELLQAFQKDPQTILEPSPPLKSSFLDPSGKLATELSSQCLERWQTHVDGKLPSVSSDVLTVLKSVGPLRSQVTAIQTAQQNAHTLRAKLPSGPAAFTALEVAVQDVVTAWEQLSGEGLPEPVLEFFRKVGAQSARLGDLNEDVLNWLRARKLLNAFAIKPI